jgi:hypothetical protein
LGQYFFLGFEQNAYLKLNLGLGDVSLAAVSASDLLCLADLVPDSLFRHQSLLRLPFHDVCSYLGAEVLQCVALDSIDAEDGVGLHNGESTGQEKLLAAALLLDDLNETRLQLLD